MKPLWIEEYFILQLKALISGFWRLGHQGCVSTLGCLILTGMMLFLHDFIQTPFLGLEIYFVEIPLYQRNQK